MKQAIKDTWIVLISTTSGEALVMFEDEHVRVSVPGDESGAELSDEEIVELVKDRFDVDIESQGMDAWEAGGSDYESIGFFRYAN